MTDLDVVGAELSDLDMTLTTLRDLLGSSPDFAVISAIYMDAICAATRIEEIRYLAEVKCEGMLKTRKWRTA